jgi:hypothetical protein
MSKKKSKIDWKNRIVEHGEQPASQYHGHELNARRHPEHQRDALVGSLNELGWVAPVIVSARTGKLLDGHARIAEALGRDPDAIVPFIKVDLSDREERLMLASFDPITNQATYDKEALDKLLQDLHTGETGLQQLLADLATQVELYDVAAEEEDDTEAEIEEEEMPQDAIGGDASPYQLKNEVIFPSINYYGIPDLLPNMIATVPDDLQVWAGEQLGTHHLAVYQNKSLIGLDKTLSFLSFYTHDSKFEAVWYDIAEVTEKLLAQEWMGIVSPNYSLWSHQPRIIQMWQVYRSRYVARYWQSVGIKVIPDIDWIDDESFKYNLLGIPVGVETISLQVHTSLKSKAEEQQREIGIKRICTELQPKTVLIYGASPQWKTTIEELIGESTRLVFVPSLNQQLKILLGDRKKAAATKGDQ